MPGSSVVTPSQIVEAHDRWLAAIAQGDAAAEAATRGAIVGLRTAAEQLGVQLRRLAYPVGSVILPKGDAHSADARLRDAGIDLPPVVRVFWENVEGLSLVDLTEYAHTGFWDARGVSAEFCDGVHVDTCDADLIASVVHDRQDWLTWDAAERSQYPFVVTLSPDGYHKDDISGGFAYGVAPGRSWAPAWRNFEWTGARPQSAPSERLDFLGYLRTALLECAGFPGLMGDPAFEPLRKQLVGELPAF